MIPLLQIYFNKTESNKIKMNRVSCKRLIFYATNTITDPRENRNQYTSHQPFLGRALVLFSRLFYI